MIRCEEKILDRDRLAGEVSRLKREGKRVILVHGCFDLPHVGHVRFLESARALGDCLVLAMRDDAGVRRLKGSNRPVLPADQRRRVLAGFESVDYVVEIGEGALEEFVRVVKPDVLAESDAEVDGDAGMREAVRELGGEVKLVPEFRGRSTSEIVGRIRAAGAKK